MKGPRLPILMKSPAEQPWPSRRRAWYGLAVLTVALMVSTIDRSILSLLVGPIKHDLGVTDTQMSLLLGMAFVSIYAFLGLPIARLADVSSRRLIIGIGIAFWSAMTTLSGVVHTYWQLFLARDRGYGLRARFREQLPLVCSD
jgi:MFS family permease